ncbi:MAG: zinc-ribbon domain containing protein [Candidatus Limnocylindrales bacterium]
MFTTTADKSLTCNDCSSEFVFTASEQEFYAERQFSEPRRCPSCRAARKLARGGSGDPARGEGFSGGGSRQMHSTTCASCGREAKVPFQPTGSKPVYCSDCFTSQRQSYR